MDKSKAFTSVLCALLGFIMILFVLFIVVEAEHDCRGEGCNICMEIQNCLSIIRTISVKLGLSVVIFVIGRYMISYLPTEESKNRLATLVALKVKLTN